MICCPRQMPRTGRRPRRIFRVRSIVSTARRGSPGPFESTNPSACSSSNGWSHGTRRTRSPRATSADSMLRLHPRSTRTTVRRPSPRVTGFSTLTSGIRLRAFGSSHGRSPPLGSSFPSIVPSCRKWRVRARVSTPVEAGNSGVRQPVRERAVVRRMAEERREAPRRRPRRPGCDRSRAARDRPPGPRSCRSAGR